MNKRRDATSVVMPGDVKKLAERVSPKPVKQIMKLQRDALTRNSARLRGLIVSVLLALGFGSVLEAEQLRVAVASPELVADSDTMRKELEGEAVLWQSLLTTELGRSELFTVVERENLSALVREWEIKRTRRDAMSDTRPLWLGADWILISRISRTNGQDQLEFKVLDSLHGAIEASFTNSFAVAEMEKQVRTVTERLRPLALGCLSRRDVHTLASVLDFDSESRFSRGRWQERALARHLRGSLQQMPGVLVLEREDVEELLKEIRLRRGGLTRPNPENTNGWAALQFYPLVSGTITETQPEGAPLTLRVRTRVRDLNSGATNEFTETFPVERWSEGVAGIERRLKKLLVGEAGAATNGAAQPDHSAEAITLANKALRLGVERRLNVPFTSWDSFIKRSPSGMLGETDLFWLYSDSGTPQKTPARRAKILQAVQYLKTAIVADNRVPQIKLLLASLLVDEQVRDKQLAVELAEEVGWQFPEYRMTAWNFAYFHSVGERKEHFHRLLAEYCPESNWVRPPAADPYAAFLSEHRNDTNLTALVDAIRPVLDRLLTESVHPQSLLIDRYVFRDEVSRLFELTQFMERASPKNPKQRESQSPENRALGVALLEEMIKKHPRHTVYLCYYWGNCVAGNGGLDEDVAIWFGHAAEAAPFDPNNRLGESYVYDEPRLWMANYLMGKGRFQEALLHLEKVTHAFNELGRDFSVGRCAYETGDYERALKVFRALRKDHREAPAWAAKCEAKLGLPPLALPHSVVTNQTDWRVSEIQLFPMKSWATNRTARPIPMPAMASGIRAVAVDENDVWLGVTPDLIVAEWNLGYLETKPEEQRNALRHGRLIRWNRRTGNATICSPAEGLPHPWIWALANTRQGLWVGTRGGGVGLLNPRTGQWRVWAETNGLPMNFVRCLATDGDDVWAGFGRGHLGGLARYSARTDEWRTLMREDFPAQTNYPPAYLLKMPNVLAALKQPRVISYAPVSPVSCLAAVDGRAWCSVSPSDVPVLSNTDPFVPRGLLICDLATNGWYQASPDAPGSIARVGDRVWVSLGASGLAHCDLRGGDWQRVTRAEGLPFDPGTIQEWNGRLVIVGDAVAVLEPAEKLFTVYPFPTSGAAGLMAVEGDSLYVVRGNEILTMSLLGQPPPKTVK